MTITIQFCGAARQVTGSRHLLTVNGRRILLDCGMVQGPRRLANKLNRTFPFESSDIDAVVLSHAHIDHSGSIPRLVRLGFKGPILCTDATADLLSILLPDSAHLQESDARYLRNRGHDVTPAYDMEDVDKALKQTRGYSYHKSVEVCPGVTATFIDAGHIIGSAQVILDVMDGERSVRIAFTGDLGRRRTPILRDPEPLPACDVLITESTYGDRLHPAESSMMEQLQGFLEERQGKQGRVLIPAFSVGRTQNILWYLGQLIHAGKIDPVPIYLDSPLSTKATEIVRRNYDLFDEEAQELLRQGRDPFYFDGVRCVSTVEESKGLNKLRSGVIISASGMLEGGRILHHLEQTIGREEDCILMVGFQANGTLGRKLLEGWDTIKIFGERHDVRCNVRYVEGLSAHADWKELIEHLEPLASTAKQVFVVHGEESAATRFAGRLLDVGFPSVEVPLYRETFSV